MGQFLMLLAMLVLLAGIWKLFQINQSDESSNKFALLWGEAQLCLPYVCLNKSKVKKRKVDL